MDQDIIPQKTWREILGGDSQGSLNLSDTQGNETYNPTIIGGSIRNASFISADMDSRIEIFPDWDKEIGFLAYGTNSNEIFKILVGGDDIGDVIMGDYDSGNYVMWDESEASLKVSGTIISTDGSIGGWDISSDALYYDGETDSESAGMAPSDYPFYAGKKYADRASAPFRVNISGDVTAESLNQGGEIRVADNSDEIQTMIDKVASGGGGIVYLVPGTYVLTSDINLKDSVTLDGINPNSTTLYFSGNYGVKVVGSDAYSTGTVSATGGSQTITGSGTSWSSNLEAGYHIRLNGFWYEIGSVDSNTQITLLIPYGQLDISGENYLAADMVRDAGLSNLTITNSSGNGLTLQYAYYFKGNNVFIVGNNVGIDIDDSGHFSLDFSSFIANTSHGCDINNSSYMSVYMGYFASNGGDGMRITGIESEDMGFTNCILEGNGGHGLYAEDSGYFIFLGSTFSNNGGDGVELNSDTNNIGITTSEIIDNGGYGINIAASSCERTKVAVSTFNNNTSGALNDNGTETIVRGNLGLADNLEQNFPLNFFYGDGNDGDVTISSNTTLTSDMYYNNLTVNNGYTLNTGGYRIFVKETLTNNGTIDFSGNDGGNGSDGYSGSGGTHGGTGGTGGTALTGQFLSGGKAGASGGDGADTSGGIGINNGKNGDAGTVGGDESNTLSGNGVAGVSGGDGGNTPQTSPGSGGAGGSAGTATEANTNPKTSTELILMADFYTSPIQKFNPCAGSGGSGGGGSGGTKDDQFPYPYSGCGGGGGGAGSSGGIMAIISKKIVNDGTIKAEGGNGGNGGNGGDGAIGGGEGAGAGGGGGAGSGGDGGIILLIYSEESGDGTVSVNGGSAGTPGTKGEDKGTASGAEDGANGNVGESGRIIELQF